MLNCCIQHKLSHEHKLHTPNVHIPRPSTEHRPHNSSSHSKNRNPDVNTESINSLEFQTPNSSINFSDSKPGQAQDSASRDHEQAVSCDTQGLSHDQRITGQSESESDSDEFYEALETHDEVDPKDDSESAVDQTNVSH